MCSLCSTNTGNTRMPNLIVSKILAVLATLGLAFFLLFLLVLALILGLGIVGFRRHVGIDQLQMLQHRLVAQTLRLLHPL